MVLEELQVRLNDREYKNWLKAGRCLIILKDFLLPFTEKHMRSFHGDLLNRIPLLKTPCQNPTCRPRANKLVSPCSVCSEWQKVIIRNHRQPESTINWDNCFPPHWRTHYWEVAKAYMPRGQAKMKDGGQCDASALLNLINYCKCFSVDPKSVREVIRMRNELMHSCDFRVKDEWMRRYCSALDDFVQQFSREPQIASVKQQIEEMLTVDLSICVSGVDGTDSAGLWTELQSDSFNQLIGPEISAGLVSQWESELLQEMLQEILQLSAEVDGALTQDTQQLKSLSGFLQANRDLGERFSSELQAINSLEARQ